MTRAVVLGGGVMGEVLIKALLDAGWGAGDVVVVERAEQRAADLAQTYAIGTATDAAEAVAGAGLVLVAVKPNVVGEVLREVAGSLPSDAVVATVAAGIPLSFYSDVLGASTAVVRVMPNTPAVIGKGASAISGGAAATEEHLALVERLLAPTGLVVRVPEKDLDAVTAISGSGPAYALYLIDAMAEAGVLLGLTRTLALQLATATVEGAAALVAQSGEHPVVLRERVSSPGGTTVAAVRELDAGGVRAAVVQAAVTCRDRSVELGQAYGAASSATGA